MEDGKMGKLLAVTIFCLCCATAATASPSLSYVAQNLGGGLWGYNYTITNDLAGQAIDSFSVDFAPGLYCGLRLDAAPTGWGGSSVADPIFTSSGPNPGYFFGLADPGFEVAPGTPLNGFSLSFAWDLLDLDANGALLNPPLDSPFGVLAAGDQAFTYTTILIDPPAPAPEPSTILLVGLGVLGLAGFRKPNRAI
jgi:hypothetical protein